MKLFTTEERERSLKSELDRIVEIIQKQYAPEKIILFGSLADGDVHEWSDIDLLIVKQTDKRPIERTMEVFRLIQPQVGVDLFIYTPGEYEFLFKEKFSFLRAVLRTGKVLYEKRN